MSEPIEALQARMAELERRVWDGTDDRAYCLRWIGIYAQMTAVAG